MKDISPLVRSDIATRRTKSFLKYVSAFSNSSIKIRNMLVNKNIKNVRPKLIDLISKQNKDIVDIDMANGLLSIVNVSVDYNCERIYKYDDVKHGDTLLAFKADYYTTGLSSSAMVLVSWHAVKRLVERSSSVKAMDNDELLNYIYDIVSTVHNNVGHNSLVSGETYKVLHEDLQVVYCPSYAVNQKIRGILIRTILPAAQAET